MDPLLVPRYRKESPIINIAVVARNTLLRAGVLQILADVSPNVVLSGFSYTDLDRHPDRSAQYDILMLSIASPERLVSLVSASLKAFAPKRIILMAEGPPDRKAIEQLPDQVVGYIDKSAPPESFINCVQRVLAGGHCFPWPMATIPSSPFVTASQSADSASTWHIGSVIQPVPSPDSPSDGDGLAQGALAEAQLLGLTPRQYEVLVLLSRGHALKSVARVLDISLGTTKAHTESVYQRLGAHNRNAAVYIARARGATLDFEPEPVARRQSSA